MQEVISIQTLSKEFSLGCQKNLRKGKTVHKGTEESVLQKRSAYHYQHEQYYVSFRFGIKFKLNL